MVSAQIESSPVKSEDAGTTTTSQIQCETGISVKLYARQILSAFA